MPQEIFDGAWSANLVDHLSGLLCKLAVLADSSEQGKQMKEQAIQENNDTEHSENMHIE